MAVVEENSLEALLHKATHPVLRDVDWPAVSLFIKKVNTQSDGASVAAKLLAYKIQSPLESESLLALTTLEACSKHCGKRFQDEIGKFRFLNEMIKLVSPKYLGNKCSAKVKTKVIEILFSWTQNLKDQPKVQEAYDMLKRQGIISKDPIVASAVPSTPPPPRPRNPIFDDEERSQTLQRLLQSKNRDDLQAANRLIKNMVKEDEQRVERISRRVTEVETVNNNVKLLEEMLASYRPGISSSDDLDLMKELYQSCERLRPSLFRLASEVDDKDDGIVEVLKANDMVSKVITEYQRIFASAKTSTDNVNGEENLTKESDSSGLFLLDFGVPPADTSSGSSSLVDDQLLALGIDESPRPSPAALRRSLPLVNSAGSSPAHSVDTSAPAAPKRKSDFDELGEIFGSTAAGLGDLGLPPPFLNPVRSNNATELIVGQSGLKPAIESQQKFGAIPRGLTDIDLLSETLLRQSLPANVQPGAEFHNRVPDKIPMNQLSSKPTASTASATTLQSVPSPQNTSALSTSPVHTAQSPVVNPPKPLVEVPASTLMDVTLPLEAIETGAGSPISFEEHGLTFMLTPAKNRPKPNISVAVLTVFNRNSFPVNDFEFKVGVPEGMCAKLQAPSGTNLPAFNPIVPPATLTQILLVENSTEEMINLKYTISYSIKDSAYCVSGRLRFPTCTYS